VSPIPHARIARGSARRSLFLLLLALAGSGCSHVVLLHDPLTAREHNDLGAAYEAQGKTDLAAREYRAAIRLDDHWSVARVNLGNAEAARGDWTRAERCYRRALRDSATDADAMNNLAVALLERGRHLDEACALAGRAVAIGGGRDSIYRATLAEVTAARDARPAATKK